MIIAKMYDYKNKIEGAKVNLEFLKDLDLSWSAKAIFFFMLCHSQNNKIPSSVLDLNPDVFTDREAARDKEFSSALNELKHKEYVFREFDKEKGEEILIIDSRVVLSEKEGGFRND